jgi:drug/metabolite transporter (DMT)-like permease
MVMMAIERIGASLTSQIGMIGPMSTLTMAALLLDEPLTVWILIGTALVVGGVYWVTQSPKVVE